MTLTLIKKETGNNSAGFAICSLKIVFAIRQTSDQSQPSVHRIFIGPKYPILYH